MMTRFLIGGLITLVVALIGGAVVFGNLQGRIEAIENIIDSPVKKMQEEGGKINEELRNNMSELQKSSVPSGTIAAFIRNVCPGNWSELDGVDERPSFKGRFLVGVGPYPQDQEKELRISQTGGSHRMRIKAYGNQAECCTDDQSIIELHVEWEDEGEVRVAGRGDGHKKLTTSSWMNHFPPYVAVRWCMKD